MYYVMSAMILALSVTCFYLLKKYKETLEKLNMHIFNYKKDFRFNTEKFKIINFCVQCSMYDLDDFIRFASGNCLAKMLYTTFIEEQITNKDLIKIIYENGRPTERIKVEFYGVRRINSR